MYKDINSNDWQKLELKKGEELTYTGDLILPYDNDYQYKIVVKGDKLESDDIEDLSKYSFLPEAPTVSWTYNDGDGINFTASGEVDKDKIKSVEVIVNNNKEKTYKCKYKEEPLYDENDEIDYYDDEIDDEIKCYETSIPKEAYGKKLNSLKMKVTYKNGVIDIEEVIDEKCTED